MKKRIRKRHCKVPFCDSFLENGLFSFPKDISLKKEWLEVLNLPAHGPSDKVCFYHFKPKFDYCQDTCGRYVLSKDAIPSLCLPPKSHFKNGPKSFMSEKNSNIHGESMQTVLFQIKIR